MLRKHDVATAAFKETVDSIAGRPSRDTRFAAALIVLAVLAHSSVPRSARCGNLSAV